MQGPGQGNKNGADLYSLLNLGPEASNDEIQKAYKTLSKTFHPDRLRAKIPEASDLAQATFVKIKAARKYPLCRKELLTFIKAATSFQ